jgi:hypothetical protein
MTNQTSLETWPFANLFRLTRYSEHLPSSLIPIGVGLLSGRGLLFPSFQNELIDSPIQRPLHIGLGLAMIDEETRSEPIRYDPREQSVVEAGYQYLHRAVEVRDDMPGRRFSYPCPPRKDVLAFIDLCFSHFENEPSISNAIPLNLMRLRWFDRVVERLHAPVVGISNYPESLLCSAPGELIDEIPKVILGVCHVGLGLAEPATDQQAIPLAVAQHILSRLITMSAAQFVDYHKYSGWLGAAGNLFEASFQVLSSNRLPRRGGTEEKERGDFLETDTIVHFNWDEISPSADS